MKQLDAFQIKLFMAFLMVLDHVSHIPGLVSPTTEGVFHLVTRCVAVWFAYMVVEGYIHTHNRLRYTSRLFLWAGVMFAGNSILNYCFREKGIVTHNNIFMTLALGELLLNILFTKIPGSKEWKRAVQGLLIAGRVISAAGVIALCFLFGEGTQVVLPFMIITYVFRNMTKVRNLLYCVLSAVLLSGAYVPYPTLHETIDMFLFNCDGAFITVLPFLYLYNGKQGINTKFSKYFFYVFYPAHLWLIAVIAYFVS